MEERKEGRRGRMEVKVWIGLLVLSLMVMKGEGLMGKHKYVDDVRPAFFIENFGFEGDGHLLLNVSNFLLDGEEHEENTYRKIGFYIKITQTKYTSWVEDNLQSSSCLFDVPLDHFEEKLYFSKGKIEKDIAIRGDAPGYYNIYFVNCSGKRASFTMETVMYNYGMNYLSAADDPLPSIYSMFVLVYMSSIVYWLYSWNSRSFEGAMKGNGKGGGMKGWGKGMKGAGMVMGLIGIRGMMSVFHAVEYQFLKFTGKFAIPYLPLYMLEAAQALLIGLLILSSWSSISLIIIDAAGHPISLLFTLQFICNVFIFLGSFDYYQQNTWYIMFNILDCLCCYLITSKLTLAIETLSNSSVIDGKGTRNLEKVKLIKQFYILMISFISISTSFSSLLRPFLIFRFAWLPFLIREFLFFSLLSTLAMIFNPMLEEGYTGRLDDLV